MSKALKESTSFSPVTQNFFQKYGQAAAQNTIIGDLLKFQKFGDYVAGSYDDAIPLGSRMVAYMNSFCVGFTRWEANRPAERIMGPVGEGFVPPKRDELGYLDQSKWEKYDDGRLKDPWQFTNTVVLKPEKGEQLYTFTTSSKGGLGALGELAKTFGNNLRQHPDDFPVVELGRSSYQHPNREYGEIRIPVLKVVGWVPIKDLPPIEGFGELPRLTDSGQTF